MRACVCVCSQPSYTAAGNDKSNAPAHFIASPDFLYTRSFSTDGSRRALWLAEEIQTLFAIPHSRDLNLGAVIGYSPLWCVRQRSSLICAQKFDPLSLLVEGMRERRAPS